MFTLNYRQRGTNRSGGGFSPATIEAVWRKAQVVYGKDPNRVRKDACGALIERHMYGNTSENGTGWEIDHIIPVSKGGTDDLWNLQPLQWQNNRSKGDSTHLMCAVSAR